jgi:hypothetical protein
MWKLGSQMGRVHLAQNAAHSEVASVRMNRDVVFLALVGFLVAWTAISIWGMIQAFSGFTDTYASVVASSPALATEAARQSTARHHNFKCG